MTMRYLRQLADMFKWLIDVNYNPRTHMYTVNIDGGLWEREAAHKKLSGAIQVAVESAIECQRKDMKEQEICSIEPSGLPDNDEDEGEL